MPSPNFDTLSVELSKKLGDAVAAATTDGDVWTSTLRDTLLNNAHRRWMLKEIEAGNYNALQGYRAREGQALTNNSKALSGWTGGVAWILSAYNSTDAVWVRRLPDSFTALARSSSNTYYTPSTTNQFYQIEGSSFILLDGGSTTGDTIVLEYIKPHTNLAANGSTDTSVPSQYWHEIVSIAFQIAAEEKASAEFRELAAVGYAITEKEIASSKEVAEK